MLVLIDWSQVLKPINDFLTNHKVFNIELGYVLTLATIISLGLMIISQKVLDNRQEKIAVVNTIKPSKKNNKRPYRRAMHKRK